jgi:hypothetical protein
MLDVFSTAQQAVDELSQSLNFNPQRQLGSGSGNYMQANPTFKQTSEQTASQEKNDTADIAASVGVGVGGGSGSGGTVDKVTGAVSNGFATLTPYLPYIFVGLAGVTAIYLIFKRKKRGNKKA